MRALAHLLVVTGLAATVLVACGRTLAGAPSVPEPIRPAAILAPPSPTAPLPVPTIGPPRVPTALPISVSRASTPTVQALPTAADARIAPRVPPATPTPLGALQAPRPPAGPLPAGDLRWIPVPYRSQFDGNPYEDSDCGPASLSMVLAAFGKTVTAIEVRGLVNQLQGTHGVYDAGTAIENLAEIGRRHGLRPYGLEEPGGGFRAWNLAAVREAIDSGNPVIPQVWYRGLPDRRERPYNGDHYIVITGYVGDAFIYNDPVDRDAPGNARVMSAAQLDLAWRNGDFPYAAVAFAGPAERPALAARIIPRP